MLRVGRKVANAWKSFDKAAKHNLKYVTADASIGTRSMAPGTMPKNPAAGQMGKAKNTTRKMLNAHPTLKSMASVARKHPVKTGLATAAMVSGPAMAWNRVPGSNRSKRNQDDRVLRQIRNHQRNSLDGLQSAGRGLLNPRSSGGYTL